MNEQSEKWEGQWKRLLTHCYGEVEANAGFKTGLLAKLKEKTAENRSAEHGADTSENDANWGRLLSKAYVPCEPNDYFSSTLLSQLKARQTQIANPSRNEEEEAAIQTILTKSYHPVTPRREFQTRLLENLKERQRSNTTMRVTSRRRTVFMSAMTSMAAAAAVAFVLWVGPFTASTVPSSNPGTSLEVNGFVANLPARLPEKPQLPPEPEIIPASFDYSVAAAFAGEVLPQKVVGLQNMEVDVGDGWSAMNSEQIALVRPGMRFRSLKDGVGHLGFSDDSIISMSPDTVIVATEEGLSVVRGAALVSVPEESSSRFRLHFPERDIAIEPGTQLAALVEPAEYFAEGGAPAPLVMVVEDQETAGGLALARGKNGVGPLFPRHLYTLDKFVTPDLPGRILCEVECEDLEKMFTDAPIATQFAGSGRTDNNIRFRRPVAASTTTLNPAGYIQKGDRWFAENYQKGQPTVMIRYLSDEYFGLANQRRDLARGLALGAGTILDGGEGIFYEIYK